MSNKSTVSNESSLLNETTLSNDSTTQNTTSGSENYYAEAQMMIRKPVSTVYNAFIDPAITTNFWFTKSNGRLEKGKTVRWEWEMYNVGDDVRVIDLIPNNKIEIEWGTGSERSIVLFTFTATNEAQTLVHIKNYGFKGSVDEIVSLVRDSTGGFTTVLDGLKCFLEHGIKLNLILDKFPQKSGGH
jgi:uncharacterized protein YndB with AHSA1/START domain